jgi:PleD family two-component response regulator
MGGQLHVNSLIGVGSVFWFEVQLAALSLYAQNTCNYRIINHYRDHPLMTSNHIRQSVYRILIVDDVPENRLLLINLLKPLGFALKEAKNGFETLLIARHWQT